MRIAVENRAQILCRLERYHTFNSTNKTVEAYPITLELGETAFGVFENAPNQIKDSIIITDKGLYYCFDEDHSEKVRYCDIASISYPEPDKKRTEEILTLYLKNGGSFPSLCCLNS